MTLASVFCFPWIVMKTHGETKAEIETPPHSCMPPRNLRSCSSLPLCPFFRPYLLGLGQSFIMCCKSDRNAKNYERYCNLSSMNVRKDEQYLFGIILMSQCS